MISTIADQSSQPWPEVLTAITGVAAAGTTLAALVITIVLASRARTDSAALRQSDLQGAAQDRAAADQRLIAERAAADQRLRDERAAEDRRQARDWQAAAALDLLERISDLQPHLSRLVNSNGDWWKHPITDPETFEGAVRRLQNGAHTRALALGDANATRLYRSLVALVVSAPGSIEEQSPLYTGDVVLEIDLEFRMEVSAAMALDLRRYSRYVRLWLCTLIETGTIPAQAVGASPQVPDMPPLTRSGSSPWTPMTLPDGWLEDTYTDPEDPAFVART